MYGDVLVPLDGTSFSEHALPLACRIARAVDARLLLALVHTPISVQAPGAISARQLAEWESHNRGREQWYLKRGAERCRERGLEVDWRVLDGDVADQLCRLTAAADLVVMACHGRHGLERIWLGSTSDTLMRRGRAPVVAVRPPAAARGGASGQGAGEPRIRHVLAAVPGSGSAEARAMVEHAASLTRALDARLTLLSVVPVSDGLTTPYIPHAARMSRRVTESRQAEAHRDLRLVARRYPDVPIGARVWRDASVGRGVLGAIRQLEPDLVIMGTHRRTALGRAILGSVADRVIRDSPVPVMVVGPAAGREPDDRRRWGSAGRRQGRPGVANASMAGKKTPAG